MPIWLQNEGAWIAIGVSLLFVVAGFVMHRVIVKVLKQGNPAQPSSPASSAPPSSTFPPHSDHDQQS